jgi:peptidoglycan/LPS O-acetylase OafA/YrhL
MGKTSSVAYRPDIDGLRAIAVLSVVGYHAAPSLVRGGYVGVDVFFVISGFLITSIILRERDEGTFSLIGFYERRARRLFPALIVVLAATALIGWYFLLPHEFRALGKHITAGAAYFINIALKKEAGYFDAAADEKPLLHLWSLAVEEQFYLVWPLLLLVLRGRRQILVVLLLITIASFASNLGATARNPASAFFLPQNRIWELSSGALLAFAAVYACAEQRMRLARFLARARLSPAAAADLGSAAGLALVLGAVFGLDRVVYPGAWALIPTLGAVLIIAAGRRSLLNRLLLSHPLMVGIGLISYSLYIWHWPLLSFRSILGLGGDWRITLAAVAAAVALAVVTYRYVEQPFRRAPVPALSPSLVGVTAAFGVLGVLIWTSTLSPRLDQLRHREIGAAIGDWHFPDGLQRARSPSGLTVFKSGDGANKVLYIGDSNIQQYWSRIERLLKESHSRKSVIFATAGGCAPVPGVREKGHPNCIGFAERAFELAKERDIGTVVIGASWASYFDSSLYYLEGDGGGALLVGTPAWSKALGLLRQQIGELAAAGKTVWLVLNIPTGASLAPAHAIRRSWSGATSSVALQLDRATFEHSWEPIRQELVAIAAATGAGIIDPLPSICDRSVCRGETAEGAPIYMDATHLRSTYVRDHARFMDATLGIETGSLR